MSHRNTLPQVGFPSSEYSFLTRDPSLAHLETEHDTKHIKNQLNTHQELSKLTAKFSHWSQGGNEYYSFWLVQNAVLGVFM